MFIAVFIPSGKFIPRILIKVYIRMDAWKRAQQNKVTTSFNLKRIIFRSVLIKRNCNLTFYLHGKITLAFTSQRCNETPCTVSIVVRFEASLEIYVQVAGRLLQTYA